MKSPRRNRSNKRQGGAVFAALAVLSVIVLAVGAYLLFTKGATAPPTPPSTDTIKQQSPKAPQKHRLPAAVEPEPQQTPQTQKLQQLPSSSEKKPVPVAPPRIEKQAGTVPHSGTSRLMAVIIDDMGSSIQEARTLAAIGVPLTFSIIPGLRSYREVAGFAHANGIETMIHIPMQSKGWPERRMESNGLLVAMSETEITGRLEEFMNALPEAVGANNHTGSEFCEREDKMRPLLTALKGRGLFFIDSVTSPDTVGIRLAQELGIKSGRRHVFLDNNQNDVYIRGQLRQAVRLAKKTGGAIVICHPHPTTIQTLTSALPELQKQGITLVPASRLVK